MRTTTLRVLLVTGLLMASASAWAQWEPVGASDNGTIYVRADSIRKEGHLRRFWVLTDLKTPSERGDRSTQSLQEADCEEGRNRVLQLTTFNGPMAEGNRTGGSNQPSGWRYVAPGSVAEMLLKFVCIR